MYSRDSSITFLFPSNILFRISAESKEKACSSLWASFSAFSSSFNTLTVPENPKTPEKKPISSLRPEPEKNNVEFNRTDFSSTPLQKKSVKRLDLEKEENVPVINKKNEEDELEIPAFIRRKMT